MTSVGFLIRKPLWILWVTTLWYAYKTDGNGIPVTHLLVVNEPVAGYNLVRLL